MPNDTTKTSKLKYKFPLHQTISSFTPSKSIKNAQQDCEPKLRRSFPHKTGPSEHRRHISPSSTIKYQMQVTDAGGTLWRFSIRKSDTYASNNKRRSPVEGPPVFILSNSLLKSRGSFIISHSF